MGWLYTKGFSPWYKRGCIVVDTLLPTQMFPRLPASATFVADTTFVSRTQKVFLILFRNIFRPVQMFPSLRSIETRHSFCVPRVCEPKKHHEQHHHVSATMCPRLPGLLSFPLFSVLNYRYKCCEVKVFPLKGYRYSVFKERVLPD